MWELSDTTRIQWFQEEFSSLLELKHREAPQASKILSLEKSRTFVSVKIPLAVESLTYCCA